MNIRSCIPFEWRTFLHRSSPGKNRMGHKKSKTESWHRNESISAVDSVSLVNQEASLSRILVRASLHGGWRSAFGSAFTKYSDAIMTSWYTSRGVRACERDSISPGPPNKEPLSDRPLGWDTNHGWYIKTRLTFIFSGCALVSPYVSASLPSGIFDGLVFVRLTGPHALRSFIWCDVSSRLLREVTFTCRWHRNEIWAIVS